MDKLPKTTIKVIHNFNVFDIKLSYR